MTRGSILERLLPADPDDGGCDAGIRVLAAYVELECAGRDPAPRYPDLAAHLRACPACREDHDALLHGVRVADGLASGER